MSVILDMLMVIFIRRKILPLKNIQTLRNLENVSSVSATLEQSKVTVSQEGYSKMTSLSLRGEERRVWQLCVKEKGVRVVCGTQKSEVV